MTAIGAAVRRVEDPPLVTGSAHYTEDLALPGALHAVFVRSVLAHARVNGIDTTEAAGAPGVIAVLTAADLDLQPLRPGFGPPVFSRPLLASDVVRFMGEAVAVVVASSREQAVDAAELVQVDYEPLEVVTDPLAAAVPGAPLLNQRVAPAPMEPNTAVAAPDPETGGITLWVPVQAPFWTRAAVAGAL